MNFTKQFRVKPGTHVKLADFDPDHTAGAHKKEVKAQLEKDVWSRRYEQINAFERILCENDVTVLKFFLYISKKEQLERLRSRLDDPTKLWKFHPEDVKERKYW